MLYLLSTSTVWNNNVRFFRSVKVGHSVATVFIFLGLLSAVEWSSRDLVSRSQLVQVASKDDDKKYDFTSTGPCVVKVAYDYLRSRASAVS